MRPDLPASNAEGVVPCPSQDGNAKQAKSGAKQGEKGDRPDGSHGPHRSLRRTPNAGRRVRERVSDDEPAENDAYIGCSASDSSVLIVIVARGHQSGE